MPQRQHHDGSQMLRVPSAFQGPFVILPASALSSIMPMLSATPQPAPSAGSPIGGVNSDRVLARKLSARMLGLVDAAVPFLAKPRTVKQCEKRLKCAKPTVYAILELLRRRGFPLEYGKRGASRTFRMVPSSSKVAHAVH